ncbi:MAG TPA: hypothetical protein VGW38_08710 [Chloroflexota bacterium]|nr:hypothetical protein [Chloroflexota bacterium]
MNELNAVAVDEAEHGRLGQEPPSQVLVGHEQAEEPGPLGQAGQEVAVVPREPAVEGPLPSALEGVEQRQPRRARWGGA